MSKIVIALGGNALGKTPSEQLRLVKQTALNIVDIIKEGHTVVIAHGNGPQVGIINLAFENASKNDSTIPSMPFAECGAMSQGYIGYHLQQAITNCLRENNIKKNCATVITQVLVDEKDEAFNHPTKPVGMFYTKEEADIISVSTGYKYVEDASRGYRRVVPSPKPKSILELDVIKNLLDAGNIVITVGGGGIPVILDDELKGMDAVIDKDYASSVLARELDADILLILTAVDKVYLNYKKDNEIGLDEINTKEIDTYVKDKQFAEGSMLPKILACADFVSNSDNKLAIITSLDKALEALKGKIGTRIKK